MNAPSTKPDRALIGILALIAVLVVVAVVVVFTRGTPQPLEAGTPERTVQDYATAVIEGDHETAMELLAPTWTEDCVPGDYGAATTDVRITLVGTRLHERTATVTVVVTTGGNTGPFGSGYEYEDVFQLERSGGDWLVTSAPWELAICPPQELS